MLTPSSPMEGVLADLDCPISDEERIAWAEEIRALRKDAERAKYFEQARDLWRDECQTMVMEKNRRIMELTSALAKQEGSDAARR